MGPQDRNQVRQIPSTIHGSSVDSHEDRGLGFGFGGSGTIRVVGHVAHACAWGQGGLCGGFGPAFSASGVYRHVPIRRPTGVRCLKPGNPRNLAAGNTVTPVAEPQVCSHEGKDGATNVGPVYSGVEVAATCIHNAHNCLCNRHLAAVPKHEQPLALKIPKHFIDAIAQEFLTVVEPDEKLWLARWQLSKQQCLLRSWREDHPAPHKVKLSVKRELLAKLLSKARGIQMYFNLATQYKTGYLHVAFQKALCNITRDGYTAYPGVRIYCASGWSAEDISDWASARSGCKHVYCFDGVNFDASVHPGLCEEKCRVMEECSWELAGDVRRGINVDGTFRSDEGSIKYRGQGGTKSGFSDTTSGNTLLNLHVAAAAADRLGFKCDILALGDDLLAACECDPVGWSEEIHRFGFVPEARVVSSFADADFLSANFLERPCGGFSFVPCMSRLLQRLWWTVSPPAPKRLSTYRSGVSSGLFATFGTHRLIRAHLRGRVSADLIPANDHRPRGRQHRSQADYDYGLCRRYGWTTEQLREAEAVIVNAADGYNQAYLVDEMFRVDGCPGIPYEPRQPGPDTAAERKRIERDGLFADLVAADTSRWRSSVDFVALHPGT